MITNNNDELIGASRGKHLITSSLSQLNFLVVPKKIFSIDLNNFKMTFERKNINMIYWLYSFTKIHTITFLKNDVKLKTCSIKYELNKSDKFVTVNANELKVNYNAIFNLTVENLAYVLLLEILKQAPKLSLLCLRSCGLQVCINNVELCNYLNKNIQVFHCGTRSLFKSFDEVCLFCEIPC